MPVSVTKAAREAAASIFVIKHQDMDVHDVSGQQRLSREGGRDIGNQRLMMSDQIRMIPRTIGSYTSKLGKH
jgi:hypothetical protein